jgi:hypothetical protein
LRGRLAVGRFRSDINASPFNRDGDTNLDAVTFSDSTAGRGSNSRIAGRFAKSQTCRAP